MDYCFIRSKFFWYILEIHSILFRQQHVPEKQISSSLLVTYWIMHFPSGISPVMSGLKIGSKKSQVPWTFSLSSRISYMKNSFPLHSLERDISSDALTGAPTKAFSVDCWDLLGSLYIQQQVQQVEALRFQQISPHMISCNNKCHIIFYNWIICKVGGRSSGRRWIQ